MLILLLSISYFIGIVLTGFVLFPLLEARKILKNDDEKSDMIVVGTIVWPITWVVIFIACVYTWTINTLMHVIQTITNQIVSQYKKSVCFFSPKEKILNEKNETKSSYRHIEFK